MGDQLTCGQVNVDNSAVLNALLGQFGKVSASLEAGVRTAYAAAMSNATATKR